MSLFNQQDGRYHQQERIQKLASNRIGFGPWNGWVNGWVKGNNVFFI